MSDQKAIEGSEIETRELLEGVKEKYGLLIRGHGLALH